MASIREILPDMPTDVGMLLFSCAKCFTKVSGSSYGTLLATGLMSAAKQCKGKETVSYSQVSDLLATALQAMQDRGKASLGEKTVLDSIESIRKAVAGVNDNSTMASKALTASQQALDDTITSFPSKVARGCMVTRTLILMTLACSHFIRLL